MTFGADNDAIPIHKPANKCNDIARSCASDWVSGTVSGENDGKEPHDSRKSYSRAQTLRIPLHYAFEL